MEGRALDPHVIAAAVLIGGGRAPIEGLLIAGRERFIPAVLNHVEIERDPPCLELDRIDQAHPRRDPRPLEVAGEHQCQALLVLGVVSDRNHDLEGEGAAGARLDQLAAAQLIAGRGQQFERAPQHGAIATGTVAGRRRPAAVEHIGTNRIGKRRQ